MQDTYCNTEFCRGILRKLVKIDSCQPDGNESDMVRVIRSFFPDYVEKPVFEHGNNRSSMILKLQGKSAQGGLAFIGHLDTVPYGQSASWKDHPLSATEKDGYIYGRGTSDMKGGLTSMIAAALSVLETGVQPQEDIYFCFTADEENGGAGAVQLSKLPFLKSVKEFIIAEPSKESLGIAEKGALWIRLKTSGMLAHSSRPLYGTNAIEKSIEFKERLKQYLNTGAEDPYLGKNTIAVTGLMGGVSTNIIPDAASMEMDIRTLTSVNHTRLIEYMYHIISEMEAEAKGLHMQIEILNNRPSVGIREDNPFVDKMKMVYRKRGIEPRVRGIFFYTDASQLFPNNDRDFMIIGPGDDAMAHQMDECVELESVVRVAEIYKQYLMEFYLKGDTQ